MILLISHTQAEEPVKDRMSKKKTALLQAQRGAKLAMDCRKRLEKCEV